MLIKLGDVINSIWNNPPFRVTCITIFKLRCVNELYFEGNMTGASSVIIQECDCISCIYASNEIKKRWCH
jgi:hypothetical protein